MYIESFLPTLGLLFRFREVEIHLLPGCRPATGEIYLSGIGQLCENVAYNFSRQHRVDMVQIEVEKLVIRLNLSVLQLAFEVSLEWAELLFLQALAKKHERLGLLAAQWRDRFPF